MTVFRDWDCLWQFWTFLNVFFVNFWLFWIFLTVFNCFWPFWTPLTIFGRISYMYKRADCWLFAAFFFSEYSVQVHLKVSFDDTFVWTRQEDAQRQQYSANNCPVASKDLGKEQDSGSRSRRLGWMIRETAGWQWGEDCEQLWIQKRFKQRSLRNLICWLCLDVCTVNMSVCQWNKV